jgi:CHAD domain-containing protein
MAYRIRPDKAFTAEVAAIATSKLKNAISILETQADGPHTAIHQARKIFKRVRALYLLVKTDARDFQRHENRRLRDIARMLSTVRNAAALIESVTDLQGHARTPDESVALSFAREALTARRDQLVDAETDLSGKLEAAIAGCRQAIDAVGYLQLEDGSQKTARRLAKAWKYNLQQATAAIEQCHNQALAEHFHDLRKTGQIYWMHLALLRGIWPSAMEPKHAQAKQLVDMLGKEHDLSVLSELINAAPQLFGRGEDLAHLLGAIIGCQQGLRRDALTLAAIVFADSAERESRIIRVLWRNASADEHGS